MDVILLKCSKPTEFEWRILEHLIAYQFTSYAIPALHELLHRHPKICKSKTTDKIRQVVIEGNTIAITIRASDHVIIPHIPFAKLLHKYLPFPLYRVVVVNEMVSDVMNGWTVFAKHILLADENIRPGDEVLVVDEQDKLLAIGRSILGHREMLTAVYGPAVIIREKVVNNAKV
ncbi:MAG TPA: pseudouridine synthase [Ignisphaera aggregans]|uniref:Pseudouridine synthase n=1 Tax=Ignisphaera aggregans TaxID=334771 RepID=A0A832YZJ3_9CREN|nr:pseudouridine synthase [Ignisphaera aggregans]